MTPEDLKQKRKALGLTQKELAAKIGCSVQAVQKWEQNDRKISGIAIKAIRGLK